jgi:hypothetical protein
MSILKKLDELAIEHEWNSSFQSNLLETIVCVLTERDEKAYDMALSLMVDWAEMDDSLAEIVTQVKIAHEELDQQDEGWYNEDEEGTHGPTNA